MRNVSKSIWCVFLCMTFMQGQAYASKAECYVGAQMGDEKTEKVKGQDNVTIIGYNITMVSEATIHHRDGSSELFKRSSGPLYLTKSEYEDPEAVEWVAALREASEINFTLELEERLKNCHPQE